MDKKKVGIILSAVCGIVLAILIFYVWSAFEDETHSIIGVICFFGGLYGLLLLLAYFFPKRNKDGSTKYNTHRVLHASVVLLSMALTGLVIFAKERHEWEEDNDEQMEFVSGKQYLVNKGWDEITVCTAYSDNEAESGQSYYVFCKNGRYIAITELAASQGYIPEQYSVTRDDYYFNCQEYNARISKNGEFLYFNF